MNQLVQTVNYNYEIPRAFSQNNPRADLGDYLNLAEKASKVRDSDDTKDIAELHDLNLNTKLAVAEFPIVFTFETDAKYGVYKVLLYADSNTTSIAGFTVGLNTELPEEETSRRITTPLFHLKLKNNASINFGCPKDTLLTAL